MKIVIAPDKFKGSLTAQQAAEAIARGVRQFDPQAQIDLCPMADGGEGTVRALVAATGGTLRHTSVCGPLPQMRVDAEWGIMGDGQSAVIEMAAASGLALLEQSQRNPMRTTTFGTGELINAARQAGCRRIIVGIGGSATTDGGVGCAQAAGAVFQMEDGSKRGPNDPPLVGAEVQRISGIDSLAQYASSSLPQYAGGGLGRGLREQRPSQPEVPPPQPSPGVPGEGVNAIIVACDVDNPLYGERGAAAVFGPQKGASPQDVAQLDAALQRLAHLLDATDLAQTPGAGRPVVWASA